MDFPIVKNSGTVIDTRDNPTLSFWCRSASKDPLAIYFWSMNDRRLVSLGRDIPDDTHGLEANFVRDGQWHQIKFQLNSSEFQNVIGIGVCPTSTASNRPKITLGPIEYSFADFKLSKDAPDPSLPPLVPDPDSPDPWARAEWAHHASHSAKLAGLLKDPDWMVRLNAIQRYVAKPDPSVEPLLIDNATSAIDGSVNAAAMDALWALQTDTAKAAVLEALRTGITEQGKAEAARLVVSTNSPDVAEPLITLSQSRTLGTRIADVQALGKLSGSTAALIRMSLLAQSDPQLKLEITRTSDPNDPYQIGKLLWSSVNETSDAVRVESDLLLTKSRDPNARSQGYHGIKDDSTGVRLMLLKAFAENPDESQRDAIRVAVTDRSARVRAAALRAFAALPKDVTLEEIGGVVDDQHPIVQVALAELSHKKGLKLAAQTIGQMKNSADPQVRSAAETL